ncbi:MAG TPA: DNA mismatch repair protein MutS [Clostridiaceae bacterium]
MKILFIFLVAIVGFIIFSISGKISQERKSKRNIHEQWGKVPNKEYTANDFTSIGCYFENNKQKVKSFLIDDITWNDLDMNRVFSKINNTQTDIGEEYLFNIMRELVFDQETLSNRDYLIEYFRSNSQERVKLQVLLSKLGKLGFLSISDYISGKRKGLGKSGAYYKILAAVFFISPFIAAIFPGAIILFFASMALNVSIYFKARNQIVGHLQSLGYIVNMISTAKRIPKLRIKAIDTYVHTLEQCTKSVKGISLNAFFFMFYTSENYFLEIIKIFFLGETIAYHGIFKIIEKHRQVLDTIYQTIGILDSLLSIASYRESIDYFTTPKLKVGNIADKHIYFTELNHPLIEKPVPNTLKISKVILVTGSNASGKSTFLKSVAINAIFAQTIYTCLAREYSSCFFNIYSSMALNDNLEAKESYYIVEIKSLKRIIEGLNAIVPCLCVIDEVLRGTNTIERIAASSEIMHFIAKNNCICLCATHDIELTQILGNSVENYHFQEFFDEDKIRFDYKIYSGKSSTRNAIKLLKILGYDENIVNNAEQRAQLFTENGHWNEMTLLN